MDTSQIINSNNKEILFQPNNAMQVVADDSKDNVPNCPVFFGVGGNVTFLLEKQPDSDPLTVTVPNGFTMAWRVRRIYSTGLTAGQVVALYNS